MSETVKRHNHYVPEMYLNNWVQRKKINTYQLLVPHANAPIWKKNSVKYTASVDNLYVRQEKGLELDDFENEFMRKYETPAKIPLMKACHDRPLTTNDWHAIIDFIAAQIVRTPAFYLKSNELMKGILAETIEKVGREIQDLTPQEIKQQHRAIKDEGIQIPISISRTGVNADENHQYIEINAIAGKTTWLYAMKHLLSTASPVLHQHEWSIVTSDPGVSWPTSDDPVICLNYYGDGHYDFKGGWGKAGSEIIMPISPSKAIYTQIGFKHPSRMVFNIEESRLVKELIVNHALMYVYSYDQDNDIPSLRPRTVNLEEYKRIKAEFEEWYSKYQAGEVPYLEPRIT